jgi:aryl-alcohol dehydrogenase-like predicted oxidoreductase
VHTEDTDQKTAVVDALLRIAEADRRVTIAGRDGVAARSRRVAATAHIPIIGPRNLAQLEDYLAALDLQLSAAQIKELDQVSKVPLGVPKEANNSVVAAAAVGSHSSFLPRAVPVA